MIGITANQFAMFSRLLLLGSVVGAIYCLIKGLLIKLLIKKNKFITFVLDVVFAIVGGLSVNLCYINTKFTPYGIYMPISFLIGFLMGYFILLTTIANLSKIVYNIKHKK